MSVKSLIVKFHRSEKKISSVLLKKYLLVLSKKRSFDLKNLDLLGRLVFILNQTTGTVSLDVVLGVGILKSKLTGNMFCVIPVWN